MFRMTRIIDMIRLPVSVLLVPFFLFLISIEAEAKKPSSVYEYNVQEFMNVINDRYVFLRSSTDLGTRKTRLRDLKRIVDEYAVGLQREMEKLGVSSGDLNELDTETESATDEISSTPRSAGGPPTTNGKAAIKLLEEERSTQLRYLETVVNKVKISIDIVANHLLVDQSGQELKSKCADAEHEVNYTFNFNQGKPSFKFHVFVGRALAKAVCFNDGPR